MFRVLSIDDTTFREYCYVDITPSLHLAAEQLYTRLGIGSSALHRAWKIASGNRRWPYRKVKLLDDRIEILRNQLICRTDDPSIIEEIDKLLDERKTLLVRVIIKVIYTDKLKHHVLTMQKGKLDDTEKLDDIA